MRTVGKCLFAALFLIPATYARSSVHFGRWGGPDIEITIKFRFSHVEFDCAHGTIMGAIETDRDGEFDIVGVYVPEGPGPIDPTQPPEIHPAHYTGDVHHKTMHLTVILDDTGEMIGPFTLTRGKPGIIFKCL